MNRWFALTLALCVSGVLAAGAAGADARGPDVFGYRWTNSLPPEPSTTFAWVDLSRTGINSGLRGEDAAFGPTPLGFSFPFYGRNLTEVAFSTNGLVTFGGASTLSSNAPIPSPEPPNQLIAVLFDDLTVPSDGAVLFQSFRAGEIAPAEKGAAFVVEWLNVAFAAAEGRATFEVILFADGDIRVQYLILTGPLDSATVGIEDGAGTGGLEYLFDGVGDTIGEGVAVVFSGSNKPPTIDRFTATPATGTAPLTVAFEAAATDPDGTIVEVRWDFDGNGTVDQTGTALSTSFTYEMPGTFTAVVTVVDEAEATASASTTITVSSSNFTLAIEVFGQGTVSSSPAGIDCGERCAAEFPSGTLVTLAAHAVPPGSVFGEWLGDADCLDGTVTMDGPKSCRVRFDLVVLWTLTVEVAGPGHGSVWSIPSGIDCGLDCAADYAEGTVVRLVPQADPGSVFMEWAGHEFDCDDGTVVMDHPKTCAAFFDVMPRLSVAVSGPGRGTVTSNPPGIDCGADCSEDYLRGTVVTLHAEPADDSLFVRWQGVDPDCAVGTVTMNVAKTCTAVFELRPVNLTVDLMGSGFGSVVSEPHGIGCSKEPPGVIGKCSADFENGTVVRLAVEPRRGSDFAGWSGDPDCADGTVTLDMPKACTASFDLRAAVLFVGMTSGRRAGGHGTVTVAPGGLTCVAEEFDCVAEVEPGSLVTVTATPAPGSVFAGFEVGCSGLTPVCTLRVDTIASVRVRFEFLRTESVTVAPGEAAVAAGEQVRFTATASLEDGSTVPLEARLALWSSSDPAVATVAPDGLATARSDGVATITARTAIHRPIAITAGGAPRRSSAPLFADEVTAHTCALMSDGSIECWGDNRFGQLGSGRVPVPASSFGPARVGGVASATDVAAGGYHTCAVLAGGTVRCWGSNHVGQLGTGTRDGSPVPVPVQGLPTAVSVAASLFHTCALLADGGVWCWGENAVGQLGELGGAGSLVPVPVPGVAGARNLAVGLLHTCVALTDGRVLCWGLNHVGQLGNGTLTNSAKPTLVDGITTAVAVTAGDYHTCALLEEGTIRCWGANGGLGHGGLVGPVAPKSCAASGGERACSPLPVEVPGIDTGVALSAGNAHTCAVSSDGTIRCWGINNTGQLGDGTADAASEPVEVAGISGATAVAGGRFHTCALLSNGSARCWGLNDNTQLGTASIPSSGTAPVDVVGISSATAISSGGDRVMCARLSDGTVRCWGLALFGHLGTSGLQMSPVPVIVEGVTDAAGIDGNCALLRDGTVRCWPPNPAVDQGVANAVAVNSGGGHRCAVIADGTVLCWGINSSGQLGNGEQSRCTERQGGLNLEVPCSTVPVRVVGITTARAIANGARHTCALLADETVRCWGSGRLTPVVVEGIAGATTITALGGTTCAVLRDGTIRCWGESFSAPTTVEGITTATAISVGVRHSCAALADGSVRCWGRNSAGELGDGTTNDSAHPVLVKGVSGAIAVAAGNSLVTGSYTCALLADGRVRCWGINYAGMLGNGVPGGFSAEPVEVVEMVRQAGGSTTLLVDSTPPVIALSLSSPPNAAGWHNVDVTVTWSVTDPESGVQSSSGCDETTVATDTAALTLTCSATNRAGLSASESVTVKLDKTAPVLSCSASPAALWPPNHQMLPVSLSVAVADAGSGPAGFSLLWVTSSEPDNGAGDGDTVNDIQGFELGAADTAGLLRAERSGLGTGRAYSLGYRGTDQAGNAATCEATVTVPHDRR